LQNIFYGWIMEYLRCLLAVLITDD